MKNNIKVLQTEELKVMKIIKEICEKENIRYFMIGGTLLGAIRHSGFIPWDDDVDLAMPRKDYERFLEVSNKYLPVISLFKTLELMINIVIILQEF